ncbi:hypothetical protein MUK42_13537 [Musa troglodytarum]|uniref:Uncharacterized protein n=1 Tax=Musa troglodytarum TaxID=320322 RepID=A0A9E7HQ74_9LILI|nr:hypothetical protein MUK42_13537 [Musa troglodytarum]
MVPRYLDLYLLLRDVVCKPMEMVTTPNADSSSEQPVQKDIGCRARGSVDYRQEASYVGHWAKKSVLRQGYRDCGGQSPIRQRTAREDNVPKDRTKRRPITCRK